VVGSDSPVGLLTRDDPPRDLSMNPKGTAFGNAGTNHRMVRLGEALESFSLSPGRRTKSRRKTETPWAGVRASLSFD